MNWIIAYSVSSPFIAALILLWAHNIASKTKAQKGINHE